MKKDNDDQYTKALAAFCKEHIYYEVFELVDALQSHGDHEADVAMTGKLDLADVTERHNLTVLHTEAMEPGKRGWMVLDESNQPTGLHDSRRAAIMAAVEQFELNVENCEHHAISLHLVSQWLGRTLGHHGEKVHVIYGLPVWARADDDIEPCEERVIDAIYRETFPGHFALVANDGDTARYIGEQRTG